MKSIYRLRPFPLCVATLAIAAIPFAASPRASAAPPQYSVTDLGTLGGSISDGWDVNNAGVVVGYSRNAGNQLGGFIDSGGSMVATGTFGGTFSVATAINNLGQATGQARDGSSTDHAFLYSNGTLTNVDGGSYLQSRGFGINDSGTVAGSLYVFDTGAQTYVYHAFYATSGGAPVDLGVAGGNNSGLQSFAFGVNNSGQVVGQDQFGLDANGHHPVRAFLYSGGAKLDLGTLGGTNSFAYGVNDAGMVTGGSLLAGDSQTDLFVYSGGVMHDMGTYAGNSQNSTVGFGINKSGWVTGNYTNSGTSYGFVMDPSGTISDLNNLVQAGSGVTSIFEQTGSLGESKHINDWGQIAASGTVSGGARHAILLTPIAPLTTTTGSSQDSKVVKGVNYSNVPAFTNPGGIGTTARLLDGTADANRDVTLTFTNSTAPGAVSDVVTLSMTTPDLSAGPLQPFVLELSYNPSAVGTPELDWLDPNDSTWKNAVLGDIGGTPLFAGDGAYNSGTDFNLGEYGYDSANHEVWAVIDHNSTFVAATAAPEPTTWAALLGGIGVLGLSRRRHAVQAKRRGTAKTIF